MPAYEAALSPKEGPGIDRAMEIAETIAILFGERRFAYEASDADVLRKSGRKAENRVTAWLKGRPEGSGLPRRFRNSALRVSEHVPNHGFPGHRIVGLGCAFVLYIRLLAEVLYRSAESRKRT